MRFGLGLAAFGGLVLASAGVASAQEPATPAPPALPGATTMTTAPGQEVYVTQGSTTVMPRRQLFPRLFGRRNVVYYTSGYSGVYQQVPATPAPATTVAAPTTTATAPPTTVTTPATTAATPMTMTSTPATTTMMPTTAYPTTYVNQRTGPLRNLGARMKARRMARRGYVTYPAGTVYYPG